MRDLIGWVKSVISLGQSDFEELDVRWNDLTLVKDDV